MPQAYSRISDEAVKEAEILRGEKREETKDRVDARSSSRSGFVVGQPVLVQHWRTRRWDLSAVVLERRNLRSYLVEAENGRRYLRNRIFLRPDILAKQCETSMAEQPPSAEEIEPPQEALETKTILRRSERHRAKKKTVYFEKKGRQKR